MLEVSKIIQVNHLGNYTNVNQLMRNHHQSVALLPTIGLVKDVLKSNDHIVVCSLDADDLWVKFKLHMECPSNEIESELELKVDKSMSGLIFRQVSQKLSL